MSEHISQLVPESLDELFSRDPLGLSDTDIEKIIAKLRADRALFAQAEAEGKRVGKKTSGAKVAAKPGMSLDDLGF